MRRRCINTKESYTIIINLYYMNNRSSMRNTRRSSGQVNNNESQNSNRKAQQNHNKKHKTFRKRFIEKIKRAANLNHHQKDKRTLHQKFRSFIRAKRSQLQNVSTSSFSCPICIDMLICPSTTACGHVFCFKCIEELLMRQATCPVCRAIARVQELTKSHHFERISHTIWLKSSKAEQYLQKMREHSAWVKQRYLVRDKLNVGDMIDSRDTEYIWCKAKIMNILYDKDGDIKHLMLHYLGWNSIYDEIIGISSQRLAPLSFFTSRDEIPHYQSSDPDGDNYRCRIDYGSTTRELFDPTRRERPLQPQVEPEQRAIDRVPDRRIYNLDIHGMLHGFRQGLLHNGPDDDRLNFILGGYRNPINRVRRLQALHRNEVIDLEQQNEDEAASPVSSSSENNEERNRQMPIDAEEDQPVIRLVFDRINSSSNSEGVPGEQAPEEDSQNDQNLHQQPQN